MAPGRGQKGQVLQVRGLKVVAVYCVSYSDFRSFIFRQMGADKNTTRFPDSLLAAQRSLTSPSTACLCRRHE